MANRLRLLKGAIAGFTLAMAACSVTAQDTPSRGANTIQPDSDQERRQDEVARLSLAKARRLELTSGKQDTALAELHKEAILRWSNPTIGSIYGEVYVWTVRGRPVALGSIYRWYHPHRTATVELVSVSEGAVGAKEGDVVRWDCESSGVSFDSVPGAPPPAETREGRLVQMRSLAREFSARLEDVRDGEKVTRDLRLLGQPVYRYEPLGETLRDGAIFAFVEGTDPEAWLLLEADVPKDAATPIWRFALARMNIDELEFNHGSEFVQRCANVRDSWMNPRANYTLFNFDPSLLDAEERPPAP
ncbi:MAG TPA: hypothetical protein VFB96_20830 [Pirellulaceae bacterium]|jgi:hypothetical protein|nr:hypothetical protein [Pirellulaceae bacterium]